jgi:hypothetical protein
MILLKYFLQAALSSAVYGAIFAAWWRLLQRRGSAFRHGASVNLLLAATLMWAQIFCTILGLGLAGVLYRSLALAVNGGVTFSLLWLGRGPAQHRVDFIGPAAAFLRGLARRKWRDALLPTILIAAAAFAWFAALNIALPAGAYDDFVFHIPAAAYFVQHHAIARFDVPNVQMAINTAPKLGELFSVWQFFVTGDDRLVCFWQLGMFLQYLLAVYALCRGLGAGVRGAVFGSILSALSPVLLCKCSQPTTICPRAHSSRPPWGLPSRSRGGVSKAPRLGCQRACCSRPSCPQLF